MAKARRELRIVAPLREALSSCELRCHAHCCGLSAFTVSASRLGSWRDFARQGDASRATAQLRELIRDVKTAGPEVDLEVPVLGHTIRSAKSQAEAVAFLRDVQRELHAAVNTGRQSIHGRIA